MRSIYADGRSPDDGIATEGHDRRESVAVLIHAVPSYPCSILTAGNNAAVGRWGGGCTEHAAAI